MEQRLLLMLANELRIAYLTFFRERGHLQAPGASLSPIDVLGNPDDSTLFTGSGMQQFKPYFAGTASPPSPRITTIQKCVRTGDIDSVGDFSHCTFFEMLGNFSFGDYFKSEVIPWTWEFLTNIVGLDPQRICVTVFEDDNETYQLWNKTIGLPPERIHRLGEDKNYWPANVLSEGPNGPCGPCSELFYRVSSPEIMCSDSSLSDTERYLLDEKSGHWVEIWNNVFTQFERQESPDGVPHLIPLPRKNNDTGAGLDRIAYISQGKRSVFETDMFFPIIHAIEELSGLSYLGSMSREDFAIRVVAEHTRCMAFCIADGILPSNEGRGYVLRYIIRRAIRYGKIALGFQNPFLHEIAPLIITQMSDFYKELSDRKELILQTILSEEEQFRRTLDRGVRILEEMLEAQETSRTKMLSGTDAFRLHDTYGFPVKLTQDIAGERGIKVDLEKYEQELELQRSRSRAGSNMEQAIFASASLVGSSSISGSGTIVSPIPATRFVGYTEFQTESVTLAIFQGDRRVISARPGDAVTVVLDISPFYAESGGQVGDTGWLISPPGNNECALRAKVVDTHKNTGSRWLHTVNILEGELQEGQRVGAQVDGDRRQDIMRNHTATHLLQAALRKLLGPHVYQKGSLVSPDRLRFDFTHGSPLSTTELKLIEEEVNAQCLKDSDILISTDVPIETARQRGAMALFGEKYGDSVRMVEIPGFSLELCGGVHVSHASQIGLLKIVSETGVAAGVRRIEAVTGRAAMEWIESRDETLQRAAAMLHTSPINLVSVVERLQIEKEELEKQNRKMKSQQGMSRLDELVPIDVQGVSVAYLQLKNVDAATLAEMADTGSQKLKSAALVLGSVTAGKALLVVKVTPDLIQRGIHAGNLVKELAKMVGGGGGGRADFATAGGQDASRLGKALQTVPELVRAQLKQ